VEIHFWLKSYTDAGSWMLDAACLPKAGMLD